MHIRSLGGEDPLEEGGHGSPLQGSCLENPMDRGAWRAAVRGQRAGHDTQLSTVLVHASGGSHSQFHPGPEKRFSESGPRSEAG